jgi:hypothetical protein
VWGEGGGGRASLALHNDIVKKNSFVVFGCPLGDCGVWVGVKWGGVQDLQTVLC